MQLGTESRNKTIAAIALLVVALALVGRWVLSSSGGTRVAASARLAPAADSSTPARTQPGGKKGTAPARSLDPTLRYDWLKASEDTKYEGSGRNIFRAQIEIPKPIVTAAKDQRPAPPPGPPPPPPITLKFFGFSNKPGEPRKAFLSQGDDVFIAKEGEIVDRRYKILHITPVSVEVEDVLNNNRHSIPLTQG